MDHSNIHQSNAISILGDDERKKNFSYLAVFKGITFKEGIVLVLLSLILVGVIFAIMLLRTALNQIPVQNYQATHNQSTCDCNRQEINRAFQSWDKETGFLLSQELVDAIYETTSIWYLQLLIKSSINHFQVAPAFLSIHHDEKNLNRMILSKPFFAFNEGHLMCMSVFLNGYGDSEGKHVSVFLHLMKGPHDDKLEESGHFPLKGTFTVELLDPFSNYDHHSKLYEINNKTCLDCVNRVREGGMGKGYAGGFNFISQDRLWYYYKNNTLYFRVYYYTSYTYPYLLHVSLPLLIVFITIYVCDSIVMFLIIVTIECYKSFMETSKHIFGLYSVDCGLIKQILKATVVKKLITIGIILAADVSIVITWEFTDMLSYHLENITRNTITRAFIVSVFYQVVDIFSLVQKNVKFITVNPSLLIIILMLICGITIHMVSMVVIMLVVIFCNVSFCIMHMHMNYLAITSYSYLNL